GLPVRARFLSAPIALLQATLRRADELDEHARHSHHHPGEGQPRSRLQPPIEQVPDHRPDDHRKSQLQAQGQIRAGLAEGLLKRRVPRLLRRSHHEACEMARVFGASIGLSLGAFDRMDSESTVRAPIWHLPLKTAPSSTTRRPARMLPSTRAELLRMTRSETSISP